MELINKEVPIDYEYTIKFTRRELVEIRDVIMSLARYRNVSLRNSLAGKIEVELDKILEV
jgi:Fe2+ transport system protein FeoA